MVERAAEPNFRFRMTLSESPQAVYREAAIGDDVMAPMTALQRWQVERVLVFAERNSRSRRSKSA